MIQDVDAINKPDELAKDRELVMKGLSTIKDFKGIVGPVAFNDDGDADKPIFVAEIKGGAWVIHR